MRSSFSLIACSVLALFKIADAGKCLETDAYITHKTNNRAETPVGNHFLNLAALVDEDEYENGAVVEDDPGHIVTTKDIDNYFNLQITTKIYIGSE